MPITISDRGTWLSFGNKGDLAVLVEGDPRLFNRYDVILLNPAKHPVSKQALAKSFVQWLVSPEGQEGIRAYKFDGEQLFHPSAAAPSLPLSSNTDTFGRSVVNSDDFAPRCPRWL